MTERYHTLASAEQIAEKIKSIASQILEDFPDRTPLFVALLRGAAPFSAQLMAEITRQSPDYHPELDYMKVTTYGKGRSASEPRIIHDLETPVNGREVVIIDDVLDKGITTEFVSTHLRARGAAAVRLAVLCDKQDARVNNIEADYKGFTFGNNWLVGMGMDNSNDNTPPEIDRWLDEIREVVE